MAAAPQWALFDAVIDGRRLRVERLLERGADPNATSLIESGSALALAAENGRDEICEVLIAAGANVNGISGDAQDTPLHRAACAGERSVVRVLLDNGALPDVRNGAGETPLGCAGPATRDLIERALTASGLDVARDGTLPLDTWSGPEQHHSALALGRGPHLPELIEAAWSNDAGRIQALLKRGGGEARAPAGAHIGGQRIAEGSTAAHVATSWGRFNALGLLLEGGVDVEAVDVWGRTPLHVAVWRGRSSLARGLLSAGADPARRDGQGFTVLDYAAWRGDEALTAHMSDQVLPVVREQAAQTAARRGRRGTFGLLWQPGERDAIRVADAITGDHWEIVLDLVSRGAPKLEGLLEPCLAMDAAGAAAILVRHGAQVEPGDRPLSPQMRAALAGRVPGVTVAENGPDAALADAVALRDRGDLDGAYRVLVGLEGQVPWLGRVQRALGDHALAERDDETATEHYRLALQIDPMDAIAASWLRDHAASVPTEKGDP